jgi:uncharacterized protein
MAKLLGQEGAGLGQGRALSPSQLESNPALGLADLPFLRDETSRGPVWVRRLSHLRGRHIGAVPLMSAGDADMGLLALVGLCPELAQLNPKRLLYLDTETTGLGGSGTLAFLVGLLFFDDRGEMVLEQLFLENPGDELALLGYLEERILKADGLVSFNGKSFDWPLLEMRRTMNRLPPLGPRPHLDLLHVARRLHKKRLLSQRLIEIERHVLGFERGDDDIPGSEIAPRYLHYLRTADLAGLAPVIEHNAWDVESMAALVGLYGDPIGLLHPEDLAQVGVALGRAKNPELGLEFAQKSQDLGAGSEALRAFGLLYKALGDKALCLASLEKLERQVDDPAVRLELAKLYEHFKKDFTRALEVVEGGTGEAPALEGRRAERLLTKQARAKRQS